MFAPGSRYEQVPTAVYVEDGNQRPYVLLRTFPPAAPTQQLHEVAENERLDLLAWRSFGDPEQFWRLCDANGVVWPEDLEVADRRVRLTLPEDVPGPEES
jgi:hypothetical protein